MHRCVPRVMEEGNECDENAIRITNFSRRNCKCVEGGTPRADLPTTRESHVPNRTVEANDVELAAYVPSLRRGLAR